MSTWRIEARGTRREGQALPRLLVALFLSCLVSGAFAQIPLATYEGPDREQKLAEAARKEGTLLWYTTTPVEYARMLAEPFEKRYGIKVEMWRARSELISQRVLTEARSGKPIVDVVHSIAPPMEALHREKHLVAIHSPHHRDLLPGSVPAHREWASTLRYVFVQAYNTQRVKREELPKTYPELLQPRWKGLLGIESSDHEWASEVMRQMGEAEGERFFHELVRTQGLSARTGHPLLTNLTASGEVPLALTVYQYSVEQAKKKGSPIDWFAIEPAIAIADGIGVARRAPHPNAALLFYDYMLSPEAEQIVARIGYVPTSTKVESPRKGVTLKVLDAAVLLDEHDRSLQRFVGILRARN
jgi:iron(III) transport system substrate-binding protein